MNDRHDEFHDPSLKDAVRRSMPLVSAPASLRARVMDELATARVSTGDRSDSSRRTSFWRREGAMKVAAALLLAIGALAVMAYQVRDEFFSGRPPIGQSNPVMTSIPASVMVSLAHAHEACAKLPDHHLVSGDNFETLRTQLGKESGLNVAIFDLGPAWKFKGAGLCRVDNANVAHALFTSGQEMVSIFSMPVPKECGIDAGGSYRELIDNYPVEAFVYNGALYGIVGSSSGGAMSLAELDSIRSTVQTAMGMPQCCIKAMDDTALAMR